MRLYVARHGQTAWNEQNRVCGITNIGLTEKGIEQAHMLALEAERKDIEIIISSPLDRAVITSKIVSDQCYVPMKIDERLIFVLKYIIKSECLLHKLLLKNAWDYEFKVRIHT